MIRSVLQELRKRRSNRIERGLLKQSEREAARVDAKIARLRAQVRDPKRPIKVGFIVQMPEIWNKEAPVYEKMVEDPRQV